MAELQPIIMFHGSHFVRHLGICNQICVKFLKIMFGVIPRNLKKTTSLSQTVFLASTNAAHTHTQTHTHAHTHTHIHTNRHTTIAIGEMQCVAFRLKVFTEHSGLHKVKCAENNKNLSSGYVYEINFYK